MPDDADIAYARDLLRYSVVGWRLASDADEAEQHQIEDRAGKGADESGVAAAAQTQPAGDDPAGMPTAKQKKNAIGRPTVT